VIYILITLLILSEIGIDITPLLAGAGILGLAIGFGSRQLVQDLIAGLFILLEDQYDENDLIELVGSKVVTKGKVLRFTLRKTVLQGENGEIYHIPNSEIKQVTTFKRMS
jgi:small conductance mechanosensitive channel